MLVWGRFYEKRGFIKRGIEFLILSLSFGLLVV
jgi:hypothetical protein